LGTEVFWKKFWRFSPKNELNWLERILVSSESAPQELSNEWSCQYILTILNFLGKFWILKKPNVYFESDQIFTSKFNELRICHFKILKFNIEFWSRNSETSKNRLLMLYLLKGIAMCRISYRNNHENLLSQDVSQNVSVRLLWTRFKARNSISEPGTQEPYRDILKIPCIRGNASFKPPCIYRTV
jgi:hypothetical protein